MSTGLRAFGDLRLSYDMRAEATLTVAVSPLAEATSFTELPLSPYPATSDMVEKRDRIGMDGKAISVRIQQVGASSKTEIYAIAVDLRPYWDAAGPGF